MADFHWLNSASIRPVASTISSSSLPSIMQANQHVEPYRMPHTQVDETYLNGSGSQYPPLQLQSEAMENVYYWYDGNMPYCTDTTVWQPLDDNFYHLNLSGPSFVDKPQGTPYQLVNIPHSFAEYPGGPHSYALQLSDVPLNEHDRASMFSSSTSPCTSLSSLQWSDSEPSPTPRQQQLEDAVSGPLPAPPVSPSLPQAAPPARAQRSNEAPGPRRPSIAPLAPDSTPRDTAGRRVTKQRRITRAVQPLACYFCRGRKIACGPPANQGSGDRTCEPCARRHLVCEYPAESYRGRRSSGSKAGSVKAQRR